MSISKELKELLQNKVKNILTNIPITRDCDRQLSVYIWKNQLSQLNILEIDFLKVYTSKLLYSQESIGRAKRKIQEKYPELKGLDKKEESKKVIKILKDDNIK